MIASISVSEALGFLVMLIILGVLLDAPIPFFKDRDGSWGYSSKRNRKQ